MFFGAVDATDRPLLIGRIFNGLWASKASMPRPLWGPESGLQIVVKSHNAYDDLSRQEIEVIMEQACTSSTVGGARELTRDEERILQQARRTAFVARLIVLREAKRTRSHRVIEMMEWDEDTTAEELHERFRQVFIQNRDNMIPVDRDLRRALAHASRSLHHFVQEYSKRATTNFIDALYDYERSNQLLFGDGEQPKPGGWRLPRELERAKLRAREVRNNGQDKST